MEDQTPTTKPACCCSGDAHVQPCTPANASSWRRYILPGVLAVAAWWLVYHHLALAAAWFTYSLCGLVQGSHLASAVEFFVFETPNVLLLLVAVVFVVGIIRTFFTPERTRRALAGRRELTGGVLAALLGIVTPFCSCSAVPLFIGFVTSGVPLGVTLSFLISSPMINEIALVLLWGLFGWKIAAIYVSTGLFIAIFAGWVIGRLQVEHWIEDWVRAAQVGAGADEERLDWAARIRRGGEAVRDIVGKVWIYVLLGIAVGAGIHGYVPENFMASIMGRDAWWSVPVAVLIGVPMYSNAASIIPIVQALLGKGAALGTVLAFMMSVIALSLPEAIILRKVLKPRLIAVFFGVVALGIMFVGFLFNAIM
ncbi:MAG: permease [Kiritimatiellaeota bacterium]|nr:permease [Kiritimatiellota bacterium]